MEDSGVQIPMPIPIPVPVSMPVPVRMPILKLLKIQKNHLLTWVQLTFQRLHLNQIINQKNNKEKKEKITEMTQKKIGKMWHFTKQERSD